MGALEDGESKDRSGVWERFGIRGSTRKFWRAVREAGKSVWGFIHGYVYMRWPHGYIGAAIGERWRFRGLLPLFAPFLVETSFPHRWAEGYHGKVVSTSKAGRLVQVDEPVNMSQPEKVIPFDKARDLILAGQDPIVVLDCPCRLARKDPCFPLDVCILVGDPFVSFVMEHHPEKARRISSEEAVDILEAEARRGHVHHVFFKEALLGRFYAICNCCSCCCGAIMAHKHGIPMLISSGFVASVQEDLCQACGICADKCPFDAIEVDSCAEIDTASCMGCGVCVRACPVDALSLYRDQSKPAPLQLPERGEVSRAV
ncbi:MAG: 4Fe-4S binding protein [Anaerolineae bacterium]